MQGFHSEVCRLANSFAGGIASSLVDCDIFLELSIDDLPSIFFPNRMNKGSPLSSSGKWIANKHKNGRVHEPGMTALFYAIQRLGLNPKCFFDVGALYGYSSLLASCIFRDCSFYCFEPNPRSFRHLKLNYEANLTHLKRMGSSFSIYNAIVADSPVLVQRKARVEGFKLTTDPKVIEDADQSIIHQIDEWSLDVFCNACQLRPDFVKMDTEGFQAKILPGFYQTIKTSPPILAIEFDNPESINSFGLSNKETVMPLVDLGYRRAIWGLHRKTLPSFRVLRIEDFSDEHECNSLCILMPDR